MDNSALGFAWGRLSHRRTRSGDPSNTPAPIEFTRDGTRYTLEPKATPSPKPLSTQHSRSKSWSTSKDKSQAAKSHIFFQFADYPNYKATLSPPNPLDLHRAASSSKGSHRSNNSISSLSTKDTSLHGSSSSIEIPQRPFPAVAPQRPPRPPRGLFEDESEEEEEHSAAAADEVPLDHTADENITGLIQQSDRAFEDVGMALADVTYNTYVAQAKPDMLVLSRGNSVRRRRQGITPPVTARRSPISSNRSVRRNSIHSSQSTSTQGHAARPPTTKKMGKRNVLLPRKLRMTLSQSVSDLLTSRASKRISVASSLSSIYSDQFDESPAHQRNSSITAAKRRSCQQQTQRHSTDSKFPLYATDSQNLTASQMYHRDMLPNSVMAWMGTDSVFAEPDGMDEADDEELLGHKLEDKCNLATEPEGPQPPSPAGMVSAEHAAEARPLSVDGSPPPPPPPKNPARFGARARTSQLAPIPEMLVASPGEGERRRRKSSLAKLSSKSTRSGGTKAKAATTRDSLYLVGTAYSRASPLFRHGHIEFQHKSPKATAPAEDGAPEDADQNVDWPKFHSSALCDADGLASGMAQDEANAMADELGEWFDEFGFESHGTLVKSGRTRKASSAAAAARESCSMESSRSSASSSSTISDADLPMPASPDRSPFAKMQSWSFGQAERNASASSRDEHCSDPIPVVTELELGLDTYGLPAEDGEFSPKNASHGGPRMSCNLSADLGQFLAWNPTVFNDVHEGDE